MVGALCCQCGFLRPPTAKKDEDCEERGETEKNNRLRDGTTRQ